MSTSITTATNMTTNICLGSSKWSPSSYVISVRTKPAEAAEEAKPLERQGQKWKEGMGWVAEAGQEERQ